MNENTLVCNNRNVAIVHFFTKNGKGRAFPLYYSSGGTVKWDSSKYLELSYLNIKDLGVYKSLHSGEIISYDIDGDCHAINITPLRCVNIPTVDYQVTPLKIKNMDIVIVTNWMNERGYGFGIKLYVGNNGNIMLGHKDATVYLHHLNLNRQGDHFHFIRAGEIVSVITESNSKGLIALEGIVVKDNLTS